MDLKDRKKLETAILTPDGKEINNPDPIEVPAHLQQAMTLQERMARFQRQQILATAYATTWAKPETEEEQNDFNAEIAFNQELRSQYEDPEAGEYLEEYQEPLTEESAGLGKDQSDPAPENEDSAALTVGAAILDGLSDKQVSQIRELLKKGQLDNGVDSE